MLNMKPHVPLFLQVLKISVKDLVLLKSHVTTLNEVEPWKKKKIVATAMFLVTAGITPAASHWS